MFTLSEWRNKLVALYRARAELAGRHYATLDDVTPAVPVVRCQQNGNVLDVYIDGPLDWLFGVDAQEIIADVRDAKPNQVRAFIDSPGGMVSVGVTLYNFFQQLRNDGVRVDTANLGMVASAAIMPFLAGESRHMPPGTNLMTHEAVIEGMVFGTRADIKQQAEEYDVRIAQAASVMAEIYCEGLGCTKATAEKYFAKEQWFDAEQALEDKFATTNDRITPSEPSQKPKEEPEPVDESVDPTILALRRGFMRQELGL